MRWLAIGLLAYSCAAGEDPLAWLSRQRAADGGWGDDEATGFALLAFVAAGRIDDQGLRCLRERGDALDHPAAALAITDAYGCFRDPGLKRAAQRWVRWAEQRARAGTTPAEAAWAALLLQSGKFGNLRVDETAVEKLRRRLAAAAGRSTRTLALVVLLNRLADRADAVLEARLLARLAGAPLSAREWLWGTAAAWQVGGRHWTTWRTALLEQATSLRDADGSWFGDVEATACFAIAMRLATRWG